MVRRMAGGSAGDGNRAYAHKGVVRPAGSLEREVGRRRVAGDGRRARRDGRPLRPDGGAVRRIPRLDLRDGCGGRRRPRNQAGGGRQRDAPEGEVVVRRPAAVYLQALLPRHDGGSDELPQARRRAGGQSGRRFAPPRERPFRLGTRNAQDDRGQDGERNGQGRAKTSSTTSRATTTRSSRWAPPTT